MPCIKTLSRNQLFLYPSEAELLDTCRVSKQYIPDKYPVALRCCIPATILDALLGPLMIRTVKRLYHFVELRFVLYNQAGDSCVA
jgi:hypothetical protein